MPNSRPSSDVPHPVEAGLRRTIAELSARLAETTRQLEQANARAEQEIARRARFFKNATHELLTPLVAVLGFADLLDQEFYGPLLPRQKQYVAEILAGGRREHDLVNNLLRLGQLQALPPVETPSEVSLTQFVAWAVAETADFAHRKHADVQLSIPPDLPTLRTDAPRLERLLVALLTHSLGFARVGGTVRLLATRAGDELALMATDGGPGVPSVHAARLLWEFERLEPQVAGHPLGSSLNLPIARSIAEAAGGRIAAESVEGEGTRVTVHLPVRWSRP